MTYSQDSGYLHSKVHVMCTGWNTRTPGDIPHLIGGASVAVLVLLDSVAYIAFGLVLKLGLGLKFRFIT